MSHLSRCFQSPPSRGYTFSPPGNTATTVLNHSTMVNLLTKRFPNAIFFFSTEQNTATNQRRDQLSPGWHRWCTGGTRKMMMNSRKNDSDEGRREQGGSTRFSSGQLLKQLFHPDERARTLRPIVAARASRRQGW